MDFKPRIIVGKFLMDTFFKNGPHGKITPELLVEMATRNVYHARKGYRDGVIQVPLPVHEDVGLNCVYLVSYWTSNIVKLKDGDYLFGKHRQRITGEDPRKSVSVLAQPEQLMPVVAVDAILYHRDVLAEDEPQEEGFDYEIVKVNMKVVEGEQPMPPETLMANHFKSSGGTATNMSPAEFEKALAESYNFWKDKAYIHGGS